MKPLIGKLEKWKKKETKPNIQYPDNVMSKMT